MRHLEVGQGSRSEASAPPLAVDLGRLGRVVVVASAVVWGLGVMREILIAALGPRTALEDLRQIWLDVEHSLPAWYSSILMLGIALVLWLIARLLRREGGADVRRWSLLGLLFAAMAMDEAVSFHEVLIDPVRNLVGASGPFHFAWVIPGAIGVALIGLYFLPFLFRLPRRTAVLFVVAGAVYVAGALGMEMVGGAMAEAYGTSALPYVVAFVVEEGLEIAGLTAFLLALFAFIGSRGMGWATLALSGGGPRTD